MSPDRPRGDRVSDEVAGRIFVECQALLNEGLIEIGAVIRLRNAMYGPSVEPIDVDRAVLMHAELREHARRLGWLA